MNMVLLAVVVGLLVPHISVGARRVGSRALTDVSTPLRASEDRRGLRYEDLWRAPERPLPRRADLSVLPPPTMDFSPASTSMWLLHPPPALRSESWTSLGFRDDDLRRSFGRQFDLEWAMINSKLVLVDSNANPYVPLRRSGWKTEESLNLPLPGRFFFVGQVGANSGSVEWQQYEFTGRTGLGMRLPSWLGGEVQLRGGRSVANYDPDDEVMFAERVTTFVELTSRWPVLGRLNLEYHGKAIPAQGPRDRDVIRQELKLAIPLAGSGQFQIGARYRWVDDAVQTPWTDRMNMFIGLQLKR